MLTLKQIMEVARLNEQCGEPESDFSPRWHEANPYPRHHRSIGLLREETAEAAHFVIDYAIEPETGIRRMIRRPVKPEEIKTISVCLDYETGADGDVRIVQRDPDAQQQ